MNRTCLSVALGTILILYAANSYGQWIQTGFPADSTSPWVSCLATKEGNLFAGTWGNGVYRSTDAGATWGVVNNGLPDFYARWVYALAVVPRPSGGGTNLFAGMEYGGVFRSTDDGDSWTAVNSGLPAGRNILAFGVAGTTILAGAAQQGYINGVYRSVNDGNSWAVCNAGFATASDSNVYSFASLRVGSSNYFYAGTANGVFMSTSDGLGWTPIRSGLPTGTVFALAANPGSGGLSNSSLFAGVGQNGGVYRSTNNGSSWSAINDGLSFMTTEAFAVSPVPGGRDNNIFVANGSVDVSTNNGTQWWDTEWPYFEAGTATSLAISGDYLFAGINHGIGGIWKYTLESDTTWVVQQSGTTDTLYVVKAVDNNVVWTGGTSGRVLRTTNGGAAWTSVGGGTIGSDVVSAVEALDANTALVATATESGAKMFKTTNGGTFWSEVFNQTAGMIGGIQMKTSLEGYAVGTPVGGKWTVLKSTNGGTTWGRIATEPNQVGDEAAMLSVQLLDNTIWFGTTSGKVYRSTNLGVSWTSATTSGSIVYSLHFNSPTLGLIGFDGGRSSRSTDGGASWDSVHVAGFKDVTSISGIGNEFWAVSGNGISYTNTVGNLWINSSPGHWGLFPLLAVSMSPVASTVNGWAVGKSGIILHYQRRPSAVGPNVAALPSAFVLEQNYPNPFNPTTTIRYTLPQASHVTLKVYDVMGREAATLVSEVKQPGTYSVRWDASGVASGVYFDRLSTPSFVQTRKLLLLR